MSPLRTHTSAYKNNKSIMAINDTKPMTAEEYKAIMDAYEIQNPLKFADKKEAMEAKLKALTPAKKTAKKD